ncbi:MAG: helix-turn-helix domain-containing protein [Verrucomicrobia subdivision 3 bacterium]|nr:helix-turn-helix domain-containing protein [Limisphaerales bacterium]
MHNNETKDKFVELRAAGQSFGQISEQLGVAKSTLHHWEDERADDIARLRRLKWEETEAEWGERIEDQLTDLACFMKDCKHRINQFTLDHYSLRDAFAILRESRREYFRLRAILMGTPSRTQTSVRSVSSVVQPASEKPNKTERFTESEPAGPLITNDLQQPKPESFDFPTANQLPSPPDSTVQRFNDSTHSTLNPPPSTL